MAAPTRSSGFKAPSTTQATHPAPSPWSEARLVLAAIFGLLGLALFNVAFLDEQENAVFMDFLRGQVGMEGAFASVLFWKLFVGFALGAVAGYFVGSEVPRAHVPKANQLARGVAIFLISVVIYIPAMSAGFIWDDDQEITANPSLQNLPGLVEIWTGAKSADYFPLKTTMLWIEFQLWGLNAHGYHTVNIIVHAIDALLLWMVLSQLKVPGAWLGSLLFAIHPVHAESVAWIAERKNTLSLFFYLLSISAWLRFEDTEKRKLYLWSLVLFLGALLCKTHVVVLPAVLVLLTWWKTGTLTKRDLLRTVPFFVLALVLGVVTVWFQNGRAIGQEVIPISDHFSTRLAGSGVAIWWYVSKALFPVNLNTIYNDIDPFGAGLRWPITEGYWWMFVAGAFVLITLHLLWLARNWLGRTPFFVFAYFVGTLFPVLGFFKMSYMRLTLVADHFQYLSDISVVALTGALIALGLKKLEPQFKPILIGSTVVLVFCFSAYSWERAGVHQSEKTLWTACLAKNNDSWQAHNHLGAVIYMEGRPRDAAPHFQRAVDLKPANPEVHNNLGLVLAAFGQWEEALAQYRQAVEIKGDVPAMRRNLADALTSRGKLDEALPHYEQLVKEMPGDPGVHLSYGYVLAQLKRLPEALREFEMAVKIDPNNPRARQNVDAVRQQLGVPK